MHIHCIVLVIAHHDNGPYDQFKQLWVKHWNNSKQYTSDMQIYYLYNGASEERDNGNDLYFTSEESVAGLMQKTVSAFRFLKQKGITYDYIFRTNLSSCIDWRKFKDFISLVPYPGFGGSYYWYNGNKHASGSGYFITQDHANYVLRHSEIILGMTRSFQGDDVILNMYLQNRLHIRPFFIYRTDIKIDPNAMSIASDQAFHFRFKTNNREKDVLHMSTLVDILHQQYISGDNTKTQLLYWF